MKPRIQLIVDRAEGPCSEAQIEGAGVTSDMLDSAEDLLHTLMTGERPVIKNLYDLVARAFNTTREEAKKRITAAGYGMSSQRIETSLVDRTGDRLKEVLGVLGEAVWGRQLFQTHDMCCVLEDLMSGAVQLSSRPTGVAARKLLNGAINFVTQLGMELGREPAEMNSLALQLRCVLVK